MQLDDRFLDLECMTCGVVLEDDERQSQDRRVRHHEWHNELEAEGLRSARREEGLRSALIKIAGDWKAAKTRNDGLHGKACVCQNCMTDFVWFKAASELEAALATSPGLVFGPAAPK